MRRRVVPSPSVSSSYGLQPRAYSLRRRCAAARGVTLLELLVVLLILLMVTAAAVPLMAPALQNRRMREAARLTSTFISGARSRAIQTGRETGVQLVRFNGNPWAVSLAYVEYPQPYAGDLVDSKLRVWSDGSRFEFISDVTWQGRIRVGDLVQLKGSGPSYRILQGNDVLGTVLDPAKAGQWRLAIADGILPPVTPTPTGWIFPTPSEPWTDTNLNGFREPSESYQDLDGGTDFDLHQVLPGEFPYQIFRQPVRTSDTPMQLPEGVVIDLLYSGIGIGNTVQFGDTTIPLANWPTNPPVKYDPIITFTPNGSVGHVGTMTMFRPTATIYLLLGRRELMSDVNNGDDYNLYDPRPAATAENLYLQNFWITIGYQTGMIATSEVYKNPGNVATARFLAQSAQSIGGQ
ncbi:MAG: prepilin-type N-terminal cleavage/methylation domain-containing protein [Pirellulales bacterium]